MKTLPRKTYLVTALVLLTLLTNRVTAQTPPQVEEKYNRFKDYTSVSLKLQIQGEAPFGLQMHLVDGFEGKTSTAKQTGNLPISFMSFGERRQYGEGTTLIFLADGERIRAGEAKYLSLPLGSIYSEVMMFTVSYETLGKLANAKTVEAQLGDTEVLFKEEYLKALRDFLSKTTPSNPTNNPATPPV